MNSPLQLDRSYLESVHIEPTGLDKPTEQEEVEVQVTAGHRADRDRDWKVRVLVRFGGKKTPCAPYRGSVEMWGTFSVHPNYPEGKVDPLVRINGATILYGAIRETVSNLTARAEHGIYVLRSVSFVEMFKNQVPAKGRAPAKAPAKKRKRKAPPTAKRAKP